MSKIFYNNYIKEQIKNKENAENWWKVNNDENLGVISWKCDY